MTDQVANFKKVTVSTTYDASETSIVLTTGHGSELPDPSGDNYNLVWWDSTNYPDPSDDPNVEVIRVTAKSTDTLTVTRNQEGSGASTKNTSNAVYKMILSATSKTITDLQADTTAVGAGLTLHMSDTSTHGVAEIANVATVSAEIDSDITTHAGLGDAHHTESHTVASHSDTTTTGTELETLTDGSDADSLHAHAVNDAKVTNATHTGDVTGATILTIGADKVNDTHIDWGTGANQVSAVDVPIADAGVIITATEVEGALQENRTAINLNTAKNTNVSTTLSIGTVGVDTVAITSDGGADDVTLPAATVATAGMLTTAKWAEIVANNAKETNVTHSGDVTGSTALTIVTDAVDIPMLSATGTANGTTFLRGDNTWSTPAGSGDVSKVGTPVDNQVGVWTGDGTIEGTSGLTYDGTDLNITGDVNIAAEKHLVLPLHNDQTTPTLAFGDGNTGFYESADNTLQFVTNSSAWFHLTSSGQLRAGTGTRWGITNEDPSATNPVFLPTIDDSDTGIGRAAADSLSLIAGGVEGLRVTEAAGVITSTFTDNITVTGTVDGIDIATDVTANTAKVTNATHTGDVTGSGVLTIASGAVDVTMLANGTDGELITWDAAGAPDTVAVGTATHVLTSNGMGVAPTFQAAVAGSQTVNIFLPAEAAYLSDTDPAALGEELGATVYGGYSYLAFDDSTDEHAIWRTPMPDYDGGNIIFKFYWFATPTSGNVAWNIESIGVTDGEEIVAAVVTDAVEVTADTVTGTTLDLNITTHATYNPASVAADDMMVIEITRDISRDDMAADARLFGILLEYTRI